MGINVIITGSTGMVGEGVLLECLKSPDIESILVINRKPGGMAHQKLTEVVHADFFDLTPIADQLRGHDACFFCLGISSVGVSTEEYKRVTYDLTLNVGKVLKGLNESMTFCYVTGAGTDSTEKGGMAWARIKGATENALLNLFLKAYMFRPGFMKATHGQKNVKSYYKYLSWLYPVGRAVYPGGFCTLAEVGRAMINVTLKGFPKKVLEVKDIVTISHE